MGLLDELMKQVSNAMAGQAAPSGADVAPSDTHTAIFSELINLVQSKGLGSVLESFETKGLGEIVNSWIGSGANLPISADQIRQALGADWISTLAQKAGITPEQVSTSLANLLPGLVDRLTPNGQLTDPAAFLSSLLGGSDTASTGPTEG